MSRIWSKASANAAFCLVALLALATLAAAQQTMRVRGVIEKVEGDLLLIKSREGQALTLKLMPGPNISATVKASIADIKSGAYIGVAGLTQTDGSLRAISVHIFAEAMRGIAEGHRPWDLQPQSSMTNATVESTVSSSNGHTVLLKYKDGTQTVVIAPDLQIVAYVPGEAADLKAGAGVFVAAALRLQDGSFATQRITVGRNVAPPM